MQCKCGALITPREHTVTTEAGAAEWGESPPARVIQWECPACGRYKWRATRYTSNACHPPSTPLG